MSAPHVGDTDVNGFRSDNTMTVRSHQTFVHDLRERVAAIDRRVPRIEREGERDIARDAQRLRRHALKRLAELERSLSASQITAVAQGTA